MIIDTPNFVAISPFFTAQFAGYVTVINGIRIPSPKAEIVWLELKQKIEKIKKGEDTSTLIYADENLIVSFSTVIRKVGAFIWVNEVPIYIEDPDKFWRETIEKLEATSVYEDIIIPAKVDNLLSEFKEKIAHLEQIVNKLAPLVEGEKEETAEGKEKSNTPSGGEVKEKSTAEQKEQSKQ